MGRGTPEAGADALKTVLYVSRSRIDPRRAAGEIADIVAGARERNAREHITGALLWTTEAFAQVLEGPVAAVDALMADIVADPRHSEVTVVMDEPLDRRRIPGWSMAYSGPAIYVSRHVEALLEGRAEREQEARRLTRIIREFAAA